MLCLNYVRFKKIHIELLFLCVNLKERHGHAGTSRDKEVFVLKIDITCSALSCLLFMQYGFVPECIRCSEQCMSRTQWARSS